MRSRGQPHRWGIGHWRRWLVFWVSALLILPGAVTPGTGHAQSLQNLIVHGAASNCFNLVFLSEGYTSGQLPVFLADATNALKTILTRQPFQEYSNYLNAYAISVASAQSGSDHPSYGLSVSTYFNSTYDISDYLITIPSGSTGQGKVDTLLQTFVPNCHLAALLVNDLTPGGSDGFDKTAITSRQTDAWDILVHEAGHVIANLGDEYSWLPAGAVPPVTDEPNTTQQTNLALIKWSAWIPANTPIPTPPTSPYSSTVGLFEGARYSTTNWYRPMQNCLMNAKEDGFFCDVCREALVLSLYRKTRVITGYSPATNLSATTTQLLTFSVSSLSPVSHSLQAQWYQDDVPLTGATNLSCSLSPRAIGNGSHRVKAVLRDPTAYVRNDPAKLLSQTNTWYLSLSIPWIQLGGPKWLGNGNFNFVVSGSNAPAGVVMQASTNLLNWVPVATNTAGTPPFSFSFTNQGTAQPARFFRAVTPP